MGLPGARLPGKGASVSRPAGRESGADHAGAGDRTFAHTLTVRRLGINTYLEPVIYMRSDCDVCKSEGFEVRSRVTVALGGRSVVATLNVVVSSLLAPGEAGLSESASKALGAEDGMQVMVTHPPAIESFSVVRAKIYGKDITDAGAAAIMGDVVDGNYTDIEIAAFVAACAGDRLKVAEVIALTKAMVKAGDQLHWDARPVVDKHCVGGLPGNRTTLLVVPIVAACGLVIPKTSSRAITSPAGTADAMETLAPVTLDLAGIRNVVAREGGCIVWGGSVNLSPADDVLIRIERPLDFDSEGQLVASVLSKKISAGSSYVLIDIPVGPSAKVRTRAGADSLSRMFVAVGQAFGLTVKTVMTDGTQPVGRGIGPALEARDVLAVLQNEVGAPEDLRSRALLLAGQVLELGMKAAPGEGAEMARTTLASGAAWRKFQAICDAQGGQRLPPAAAYRHDLVTMRAGRVVAVDNRRLARIAKLAGAPKAPAAGLLFHAPIGTLVDVGQPLMTIHAASPGELAYARAYADLQQNVITIEDAV